MKHKHRKGDVHLLNARTPHHLPQQHATAEQENGAVKLVQ